MRVHPVGLLLLLGALGGTLAACDPYDALVTPNVNMKVVDAETLQPIDGATVTVAAASDPRVRGVGQTDQHGMVHLPALEQTIWPPPVPISRPYPPVACVTVEAPGYQAVAFRGDGAASAAIAGSQPVALTRSASSGAPVGPACGATVD
jgi:hypothetical protein